MFSVGGPVTGNPESVRLMFESIAVQAQSRWHKEHDSNGAHKDVTALSIATPRLRLRMAGDPVVKGVAPRYKPATPDAAIFVRDVGANGANGLPLALGPHVMFVSIRAPGGSNYLLYGIQQQGVQFGDVLFVRKDPASAANVTVRDRVVASVPVGTEIHVPQDCAESYPEFYLSTSGAWLPLIYSPGAGTANVPGWSFFYTYSL
jgi:hypothetical protein